MLKPYQLLYNLNSQYIIFKVCYCTLLIFTYLYKVNCPSIIDIIIVIYVV